MSRVIHFEIPASDPERASAFYKKVFGWKIEKWPGPTDYWLVNTGAEGTPGINGGLMKKTEVKKTTQPLGVGSVDPAVKTGQNAPGKLKLPQKPNPHPRHFFHCPKPQRQTLRRHPP